MEQIRVNDAFPFGVDEDALTLTVGVGPFSHHLLIHEPIDGVTLTIIATSPERAEETARRIAAAIRYSAGEGE